MTLGARTNDANVLVVGLENSGKTSLLAATWYELRRPGANGVLELDRLPSNAAHLNRLTDTWLRCEPPDHTSRGTLFRTRLRLRRRGGPIVVVTLPDYSGELIREAWATRRWRADLTTDVSGATALILLIHPSHVAPHVTIADAARNAAALGAGEPDADLAPLSFDKGNVPTQTMLVDFIQFARKRSSSRPLRVAVVVSAWDTVEDGKVTPDEWLRAALPLLYQFLVANTPTLPSTVFGVSAQGAEWPEGQDLSLDTAALKRASARDADGQPLRSITAPLVWATDPT